MTKSLSGRLGAKLCSPHSLQHLLDLTFGLRELLCIAGAQRRAADRKTDSCRSRLRDWLWRFAELHSDIAFARIRAHRPESMRTPLLSLGATSSSIACMIEGTPAITITLPIQKPGAPDTLLRMRSAPLGMHVMRRRASLISAPVVFTHSCRMASARVFLSIGTPNAFATQSGVMSPWVGPIPPVVKT